MYPDFLRRFRGGDPSQASLRPLWTRHRGLLFALLVIALIFAWLSWRLPLNRALAPLPEPTLILLDRNDEPFARRGAYKEAPVDARRLPPHVIQAVLAIEDRRFFQHGGVDPRGIGRAFVRNAQAGEIEQGGSTITQQLAKTSFLSSDRTLRRKVQESLIALWLELRLDKQEILSRYLSGIYFGDGVYGLGAAARHYFDVAPEQLGLAQAAMLAGMIKAPSALAPTDHLDAARERAQVVLDAMVETGAITAAEAGDTRPATVRSGRVELPVGSYFADWMSPQAKDAFDAAYGEVPVRTTLDSELQQHAERVLQRSLARRGRADNATQAALIAMRPNGEVVAMVGGRDYEASAFNRVTQAKRQPGSAFKLFVYRAALHDGATPDTLVDDSPVTVGDWSPSNYSDTYRGRIPLREAFAHSSNAVAVRLAQDVGTSAVVRSARELGITTELGDDASIALGSYETTLLELTAAYAAIAAGVAPVVPYGVAGHPVDVDRTPLDTSERAMLLDLLWSAVEQGTGRAARLRVPTFGKTGTTQDYRDALFIGMAGDLVTGVWVGNDDNSPMRGITGGTLPAQIWRDFMAGALDTQHIASVASGSRDRDQVAPVRERRVGRGHGHKGKGKGKGKGRGRKKGK